MTNCIKCELSLFARLSDFSLLVLEGVIFCSQQASHIRGSLLYHKKVTSFSLSVHALILTPDVSSCTGSL